MTKWIAQVVVLIGLTGAAVAQPAATGSAAPAPAAAPAVVPTAAPAVVPTAAPADVPTAVPAAAPGDARKACTAAMNADPEFAKEIVKVADEKAQVQRDNDTIKAHQDAVAHVQKNEGLVIYAYAAMWIVAALFVIFLWRRQQGLHAEIATLRRDLDAATADEAAKRPS